MANVQTEVTQAQSEASAKQQAAPSLSQAQAEQAAAQTAADQAKAAANLTDAQATAKTAVDANSNAAIFVGILSILSSASLLFFLFGKRKKN